MLLLATGGIRDPVGLCVVASAFLQFRHLVVAMLAILLHDSNKNACITKCVGYKESKRRRMQWRWVAYLLVAA